MLPNDGPRAGRKLDQGNLSKVQVLLIAQVPITRDQAEEARGLGGLEQIAVRESGPAHGPGSYEFDARKGSAQPVRGILVEDKAARHRSYREGAGSRIRLLANAMMRLARSPPRPGKTSLPISSGLMPAS